MVTQREFSFHIMWDNIHVDTFGSRHFAQRKADDLNIILDRLLSKYGNRLLPERN